jgi:hypothetical protein
LAPFIKDSELISLEIVLLALAISTFFLVLGTKKKVAKNKIVAKITTNNWGFFKLDQFPAKVTT